jgi:uncharacterized membrane protein
MTDLHRRERVKSAPDNPRFRLVPSSRTEMISDGVFAIAIILLVLDLRVPGPAQQAAASGALQAILEEWRSYASYRVTFFTVAYVWMNHHALFNRIRFVDPLLQWINMAILLGVCLAPFPNALVADATRSGLDSEAAKAATAIYAMIFALATAPWFFFWNRLARHPELLEATAPAGHPAVPGHGARQLSML